MLFREIGVNYEGGILDGAARAAIHWSHRVGALLVLLVVGAMSVRLLALGHERRLAGALAFLLLLQIALGISNVVYQLPLLTATAHNAVAALLLGALLVVLSRVHAPPTIPAIPVRVERRRAQGKA